MLCLSDDDGLEHIDSLLKSRYKVKDMGTLGFEDSDVKSFLLLNRVFRVGVENTGQSLDIEPDLRHAPLIISESGCNTNTRAVSTPREKLQDKVVFERRRSSILKKDETTRYRSACMRFSYLAQDRLDLDETAKHLAQRMSEPQLFDYQVETCSAVFSGLRYRRQKHVDKITIFVGNGFAGDPVSRKSTKGLVAWTGSRTVKFGSELDSIERWRSGFHAVVKGGQLGLSLRSVYQELGISMKIKKESDSSTANSLTDGLGAGQRRTHIDTRYFWIQERVQDGDFSIKKVPTVKNCADVGTKTVSASVLQQHCKGLVFC